jgi:hypothetical protein
VTEMEKGRSHKKSSRKNPAILLGVLSIALLTSTIGVISYYIPLTNRLNAQIMSQEANISTLNSQVENLTNQKNIQNIQVIEQKSLIDNQSIQISNFQSQLGNLTSQVTDLNSKISILNKTVNDQNRTIEEQSFQISRLLAQLSALRTPENITNPPTANEISFSFHLQDYNNNTIPLMQELNVKWVRFDWLNWNNMTFYLSKFTENNIKVLCIIDNWSVGNYNASTWNKSVTSIVNSEGAKYVSAWEIWNEPNKDMSASDYYQALKSAYLIIKNQSSSQSVIGAGLAPFTYDDLGYYRELYNNSDIQQYMDFQGVHPYFDNARANLEYVNNVTGIIGIEKVWITETGIYSSSPYNETYQADYVLANWDLLHTNVEKIFWYEFKDYEGNFLAQEDHFGVITINDIKKPVFYAIEGISIG